MAFLGPTDWSRSSTVIDPYDPNAGLDPEVIEWAATLSVWPFENVRIEPRTVCEDGKELKGFIFGEAGDTTHLVYVRATVGDEQETGAGPMPGILLDRSLEMGATPHVVRVHFTPQEEGTSIEYFGHEELLRELRSGDYWRRKLLRGRTARDMLRLVGGSPSKLEVKIRPEPPRRYLCTKQEFVGDQFVEVAPEPGAKQVWGEFPGRVCLEVGVDTLTPRVFRHEVSIGALVASVRESDVYYIFTCDCGSPDCAGIHRGVEIVHEDGLVVWRMHGIRPRRLVVFEREQYRQEILTKAREALDAQKAMGPKALLGAGDQAVFVEEQFFRAGDERGQ